jgi:hypothetical protein
LTCLFYGRNWGCGWIVKALEFLPELRVLNLAQLPAVYSPLVFVELLAKLECMPNLIELSLYCCELDGYCIHQLTPVLLQMKHLAYVDLGYNYYNQEYLNAHLKPVMESKGLIFEEDHKKETLEGASVFPGRFYAPGYTRKLYGSL